MSRRNKELARALGGYDRAFEERLTEAIMAAIADCSRIDNVLALRTGETARALTHILAAFLALSPAATRSPSAIRKTAEAFRKKLIANVASAERSPVFADFKSRCFRDDDRERGGHA